MTAESTPGPVLIAYDGSDDARQAIADAATLLRSRPAYIVTVWQGLLALPTAAWAPLGDVTELQEELAESASALARRGVELAGEAGLQAQATIAEARGPVWDAIVRKADELDAAIIVLGSRGYGRVRSALLGSVSTGVAHHAHRPVLVARHPDSGHTARRAEAEAGMTAPR